MGLGLKMISHSNHNESDLGGAKSSKRSGTIAETKGGNLRLISCLIFTLLDLIFCEVGLAK